MAGLDAVDAKNSESVVKQGHGVWMAGAQRQVNTRNKTPPLSANILLNKKSVCELTISNS